MATCCNTALVVQCSVIAYAMSASAAAVTRYQASLRSPHNALHSPSYDDDEEFLRTIGQFWTVSFSLRMKVSQTLQIVLCITTNKYLVRVLVVLLHVRFSVVSPIPFLLATIFFSGHPYIGSTTVLSDNFLRTPHHTN